VDAIIPVEVIEGKILLIRGQKVMVDADLAELYGVPTKVLNQAVKRNKERFPIDFMFQSQIVTTSKNSSFHPIYPMHLPNMVQLCLLLF